MSETPTPPDGAPRKVPAPPAVMAADGTLTTTAAAAPGRKPRIRPRPQSEDELGWKKQPMVAWLDPRQLSATAVRALLSSVFGSYADKREVQAALAISQSASDGRISEEELILDYSRETPGEGEGDGGFWIDYAADLGDGFQATYTLASLLGADALRFGGNPAAGSEARAVRGGAPAGAGGADLPRGRFLVMGGDQVYPTASRQEYADRCAGPYEAALPGCPEEERAPRLFAIPGNHDWYDGLTAFSRLFGQGRWIGGWKTEQKRSYFAIKLPARWWLLGIDVQLGSDIDKPQMDYFCEVAKRYMQPGDRVILATAEPAWCFTKMHDDAFDNLAFFESAVLVPAKAELALTLTGDLHHYARYQDAPKGGSAARHKITAGGGGAYLLGTGWLPEKVPLTKAWESHDVTRETEDFHLVEAWPDRKQSRKMRWGALRLALDNRSFACFLGTSYATFAWFLQSASMTRTYELDQELRTLEAQTGEPTAQQVLDVVQKAGGNYLQRAADTSFTARHFGELLRYFWDVLVHAPTLTLFALLFVVGMIAFCAPDPGTPKRLQTPVKVIVGGLHGALHVVAMLMMTWAFARINVDGLGLGVDSVWQVGLFVAEMFLLGGGVGATLFALFLLPGLNYNEAFSAQHLEGFKNFLRMRIDPRTGELAVYPFGVERAGRWVFDARPDTEENRLRPYFRADGPEPAARLIEEPIRIPGAPQPAPQQPREEAAVATAGG